MKENKKFSWIRKIFIFNLFVLMVSSTAISFAYWKSGVEGNVNDKDLTITIGEGKSISTIVNLADVSSTDADKNLIPHTRDPLDYDNATTSITFVINVKWNADYDPNDQLDNYQGELLVENTGLYVGGVDFLGVYGVSEKLFIVSIGQTSNTILGNDANGVDVSITITMSEPLDVDQYNAIVRKALVIELLFTIVAD